MNKYWAIGDIHGEYGLLLKVFRIMKRNGFSFKNGDRLVQTGDRCDRGKDSYRVNNFFFKLSKRHPQQIICLMGNHDRMLLDATNGNSWLFSANGGNATLKSYQKKFHAHGYGMGHIYFSLIQSQHLDWLRKQPLYHETPDYFFCHAPIPMELYRKTSIGANFRDDESILTWSYINSDTANWVDPDCTNEGKISVHGHIHGLRSGYVKLVDGGTKRTILSPGVRRYGNAILLDTGAGCCEDSVLSALDLSTMTVYDTNSGIYKV